MAILNETEIAPKPVEKADELAAAWSNHTAALQSADATFTAYAEQARADGSNPFIMVLVTGILERCTEKVNKLNVALTRKLA